MSLWTGITSFFNKFLRIAGEIITEVFDVAFKIAMAKLSQIASNTVLELSNTDLTNEQKRQEAFGRIKDYAIKNLISVSSNDINLIIEIFVKKLKKKTGEQ